jgi:archaellum component FlaC
MESFYDSVSEHYGNWCREDEMNKWKKTIDGQRLKLSEQDKEIEELKDQFTTAVESGLKQQEQLKAAEELVKELGDDLSHVNWFKVQEKIKHYNNLKP